MYVSQNTTSLVLYLFIYSKMTKCFGPYSGPLLGHKLNSLRKLYSVIYKTKKYTIIYIYIYIYIYIKFNVISSSFSIDSKHRQCLKIWQYHKLKQYNYKLLAYESVYLQCIFLMLELNLDQSYLLIHISL